MDIGERDFMQEFRQRAFDKSRDRIVRGPARKLYDDSGLVLALWCELALDAPPSQASLRCRMGTAASARAHTKSRRTYHAGKNYPALISRFLLGAAGVGD